MHGLKTVLFGIDHHQIMALRNTVLSSKDKIPKCVGIAKVHCVEATHDGVAVETTSLSTKSHSVAIKSSQLNSLLEALRVHFP